MHRHSKYRIYKCVVAAEPEFMANIRENRAIRLYTRECYSDHIIMALINNIIESCIIALEFLFKIMMLFIASRSYRSFGKTIGSLENLLDNYESFGTIGSLENHLDNYRSFGKTIGSLENHLDNYGSFGTIGSLENHLDNYRSFGKAIGSLENLLDNYESFGTIGSLENLDNYESFGTIGSLENLLEILFSDVTL
ncbi:hypothetical protein WN51_03269 [Melipona quadrifasciata]|uniref:Uncharacterized protein n=1 Tax=Melipona quadrifasciata TaxID=166423 RepID=A0A0M8ZWD7_9HYME|nr:hypothetical protein WN51_03269 [Melipona quadrifasciata]